MTTPVQETLTSDVSTVDFAQASRILRTSRGGLARLILEGHLEQQAPGCLLLSDVEALAGTRVPAGGYRAATLGLPKGRLRRAQDKLVWLLHDWGGCGRVVELQAALMLTAQAINDTLSTLRNLGYVEHRRDGWHLTEAGWAYTRRFEPPV